MTASSGRSVVKHEIPVAVPYRLDLTVSALRRLHTNPVDVLTDEGMYLRVLAGRRGPVIVGVRQTRPSVLDVVVDGEATDHEPALVTVQRMLGVDRDVSGFRQAAESLPWLSGLAERMSGVRPPRYETLWEAFVNAVVFQQVSLRAASAITRRVIELLVTPLEVNGIEVYPFPGARTFLDASAEELRRAGLSAGKQAALREAAETLLTGALDATMLEALPSPEAATALRRLRGIGPWTATVILLRGLGRLDVFPMNDSSVVRNLALLGGPETLDMDATLAVLGKQRGMLYYHLLLARLESRGELDTARREERNRGDSVPAAY